MSKGPIESGSCVVYLKEKASLKYVPISDKSGISVEQLKDGKLLTIESCIIHRRKKGMQFSLSDWSKFGWPFDDIKSVQKSDGEIIPMD